MAPVAGFAAPDRCASPSGRGEGLGEGYPVAWSVYRWLPGEDATIGQVSDPSGLAIDLSRFVAALQQIDPTGGPSPGEHNFFRGEPLAAARRKDAGCDRLVERARSTSTL